MKDELPWIAKARSYLGIREVPGPGTNPTIARWLGQLGGWWAEDQTAWCGTFVAACLTETGFPKPRAWYRARAYADYGVDVYPMAYGSIVVYERGGGGHVGFVVGRDAQGRIMTLGGNQGNAVTIAPFEPWRVLAYRWPPGSEWHPTYPLPMIFSTDASSRAEA